MKAAVSEVAQIQKKDDRDSRFWELRCEGYGVVLYKLGEAATTALTRIPTIFSRTTSGIRRPGRRGLNANQACAVSAAREVAQIQKKDDRDSRFWELRCEGYGVVLYKLGEAARYADLLDDGYNGPDANPHHFFETERRREYDAKTWEAWVECKSGSRRVTCISRCRSSVPLNVRKAPCRTNMKVLTQQSQQLVWPGVVAAHTLSFCEKLELNLVRIKRRRVAQRRLSARSRCGRPLGRETVRWLSH